MISESTPSSRDTLKVKNQGWVYSNGWVGGERGGREMEKSNKEGEKKKKDFLPFSLLLSSPGFIL